MIESAEREFQPGEHSSDGSHAAFWYAVQTTPRHEAKVSGELTAKGIDCFLPTVSRLRQWSDRRKMVVEPLFAGYLFLRLIPSAATRIPVLRTKGVVALVGSRGAGTPIPEAEINSIRRVLESRAAFSLHTFVDVGQRVRIRGGALDGVEGILQARNRDQSLVVSVELIQRSIAVTLSGYSIEPALEPS